MACRFVSVDIPVIYSMHTQQLRELLSSQIEKTFATITDTTIYINLADFINGCTLTNIYYCCLPEYTARTFRNAGYFLDNLMVSDVFDDQYLADFKAVLRLFGIDTAILSFWISYLCGKHYEVIPTVPEKLIRKLQNNPILSFVPADLNYIVSDEEQLETIGAIQNEFRYAGEFPLAVQMSTSDTHSKYLYQLMKTLLPESFKTFPLYYLTKEGAIEKGNKDIKSS